MSTLLKRIPAVSSLSLSNVMENGMLKKYDTLLSFSDFEKKYDSFTQKDEERLFELFFSVLMGNDSRLILLMERQQSFENNLYGRTIYTTTDEHTEKTMKEMLELLYYFQHGFSNDHPVFENIKNHPKNKELLAENYDFFHEKDKDEIMYYFWNFKFHFKFTDK